MRIQLKIFLIITCLSFGNIISGFSQINGERLDAFGFTYQAVKPDSSKGNYVFDYPGMLSEKEKLYIDGLCQDITRKTGVETVVAIIPGIEFPYGDPNLKARNVDDPISTYIDFLYDDWNMRYEPDYNIGDLLILIDAENDEAIVSSTSLPLDINVAMITNELQPYLDVEDYYTGLSEYLETVKPYLLYELLPSYLEYEEDYSEYGVYYNVEEVPNAMVESGSFVTDPSGYLTELSINQLNQKCKELRERRGNEISIVVLSSIGSNVPHDFGVELFNHWGIGDDNRDDGLLMLMVMDEQRVEFITGYGLEATLPDALCYEIQQREMVPHFKDENYGTGLVNGLEATVAIILDKEAPSYTRYYQTADQRKALSYRILIIMGVIFIVGILINLTLKDKVEAKVGAYFLGFTKALSYGLILGSVALYFGYALGYKWVLWVYFIGILMPFWRWIRIILATQKERDPYMKIQAAKLNDAPYFGDMYPFPFLYFKYILNYKKEYWRNVMRFGKETGLPMHKLTPEDEKIYLNKGQLTEELINSVDYDVWTTEDQKEMIILSYPGTSNEYKACSNCGHKTWFQQYDKTIKNAEVGKAGKGEKMHKCKNCGHKQKVRYTIPAIPKASRYNTSGSSSGGSYGGGSSGGGSYGGGSSGGGGSGSSW